MSEIISSEITDAEKRVTVIVPSYQPDEKLLRVVTGLEALGFDDIIVVNDGSSEDKKPIFDEAASHPAVTLLIHPQNRGKGAALRTAFTWFSENRPDREGVVTADGDAQHLPADILACAKRMLEEKDKVVLGVRDFSQSNVPKRSRSGNRITSAVFLILCGLRISDTQTGLRAIPSSLIPTMLKVTGDRYEYETNMLLAFKTYHIEYSEQKIETVYIEENQTSHFRPVRDSIRIYSLILKYVASSALSTLIDLLAFYLLQKFLAPVFGGVFAATDALVCTVIARAISTVTNFFLNKEVVFRSDLPVGRTIVRYYLLAIPVMIVSGTTLILLKRWLGADHPFILTLLKAVVDTILYFLNFRIQREWVFAAKKEKRN